MSPGREAIEGLVAALQEPKLLLGHGDVFDSPDYGWVSRSGVPDITTATGQPVWFTQPWRTQIVEDDLRIALGNARRYGGHYDVTILQHLALCVELAQLEGYSPVEVALCAVHDMHEAYVTDVPGPMKRYLGDAWRDIESTWVQRLHEHFGLPYWRHQDRVKRIDQLALIVEMFHKGHPLIDVAKMRAGIEPTTEHLIAGEYVLCWSSPAVAWHTVITAAR